MNLNIRRHGLLCFPDVCHSVVIKLFLVNDIEFLKIIRGLSYVISLPYTYILLFVIFTIFQWDTRTFRLLHLVPSLEHCKLVFNSTGVREFTWGDVIVLNIYLIQNIVYAAMYSDCADVFRNTYCASFRTFDTADYSVCFPFFSPPFIV